MNLEELKTIRGAARDAADAASEAFESLCRSKIEQATKEIKAELLPQRQEVDRLRKEFSDAQRAVEDKLIELAKDGNQSKYAPGAKLQKQHRKYFGYGYRVEWETIYGVLEVVTRETQFPDNIASYSRPSLGSLIVRICTKSGAPGKKFVKWTDYESGQWKPVESN